MLDAEVGRIGRKVGAAQKDGNETVCRGDRHLRAVGFGLRIQIGNEPTQLQLPNGPPPRPCETTTHFGTAMTPKGALLDHYSSPEDVEVDHEDRS